MPLARVLVRPGPTPVYAWKDVPDPAACRHRGKEIGFVGCPSCSGNVRLKVFECAKHGRCHKGAGKNVAGLRCCHGCPDRSATVPRRIARLDARQLTSGGPGPRLNAGLTRWRGELILAYRTGWAGAQCHIAGLDDDFRVRWSRQLALHHLRANYGREDPRLFVHNDRLHVSFIGVEGTSGSSITTHQLYAELDDDLNPTRIHAPHYAARAAWEKNWSFFDHEGDLYAVYSVGPPHVVLKIDGDRAEKAFEEPNGRPWTGGLLRGGAPPVRVGDEYWHWFHGCHGQHESRRYNVGLYAFEARPPFRVTRQTPAPLMEDDPDTRPHGQYCPVLFPAGAALEGDRWLISCGVHDRWVEIQEWDAAEVEAAMA